MGSKKKKNHRVFGSGKAHIDLNLANRTVPYRFSVDPGRMAEVCPSWPELRHRSSNKVIKAPWKDGATRFAFDILLKRIHNDADVSKKLKKATARELFYVGEVYNWLRQPRLLSSPRQRVTRSKRYDLRNTAVPSDLILKAKETLVTKAHGMCNLPDWLLLGAVAVRFDLPDLREEVNRNAILCFKQHDLDGEKVPSGITAEQWTVLQELEIVSPKDRIRRLGRLEHILKGIELLVEQMVSLEAGLLPNKRLFKRRERLEIVPCRKCQPVSVNKLVQSLASADLWPIGNARSYRGSVNNLLSSLRKAEHRIRFKIEDFRDEDEDLSAKIFTCNALLHMSNHFTRVLRTNRSGTHGGIDDFDPRIKNEEYGDTDEDREAGDSRDPLEQVGRAGQKSKPDLEVRDITMEG